MLRIVRFDGEARINVAHLIPDGFLSNRQAAHRLAAAMYSGVPDRPGVAKLKQEGVDVYDGTAFDDAVSELWKANDESKVEAFLVGPTQEGPLKLPPAMSEGIPGLRSPRGGDLSFLRHSNRHRYQLVEWFGPDLSTVSVVFKEEEIKKLARQLLRRRRKTVSSGLKNSGRPSRQLEVQTVVRSIIDGGKWHSTNSIKALTAQVNRQGKWPRPVSEDTVARSLQNLHEQTKDRRFERVSRRRREKIKPVNIHE